MAKLARMSLTYRAKASSDRERRLKLGEHRKVTNVERGELQAADVGGTRDQVVSDADAVMTAAVLAHELTGSSGRKASDRLNTKRTQQPPHLTPFARAHPTGDLGDGYGADRERTNLPFRV